jgi:hypothetical protein
VLSRRARQRLQRSFRSPTQLQHLSAFAQSVDVERSGSSGTSGGSALLTVSAHGPIVSGRTIRD